MEQDNKLMARTWGESFAKVIRSQEVQNGRMTRNRIRAIARIRWTEARRMLDMDTSTTEPMVDAFNQALARGVLLRVKDFKKNIRKPKPHERD